MTTVQTGQMNHCEDDVPRMKQDLIRLLVALLHADAFAHLIIQDSFQIAAKMVSNDLKRLKQSETKAS